MTLSMQRGHKQVDRTMINMARHCAVYAAYLEGKKHTQLLYEASLRTPLLEFAQSRGWIHALEYKLPKSRISKSGSFKKVDLVLMYGNQIIGVECKFPRKQNIATYNQTKDRDKLRSHFLDDDFVSDFSWKYGYLLTVAQENVYEQIPSRKFVSNDNILDEDWLDKQDKKVNLLDEGHGFRCEVFAGQWRYVAQIDKVLQQKT